MRQLLIKEISNLLQDLSLDELRAIREVVSRILERRKQNVLKTANYRPGK